MIKPPYSVNKSRKDYPHQDSQIETIYYKDGRIVTNTLYNSFVNNNTSQTGYNSQSTKPWPNGKPPRWTSFTRTGFRAGIDRASGSVIWTPGSAWPEVNTRSRNAEGGWGTVFMRTPLDFAGVWPDAAQPSRDVLDNKIRNKLNDELNAAVMLAESAKSVDSVAKRLSTVYQAAASLRKGDFLGAWKRLGYPPRKKLSSRRRRSLKKEIVDEKYRGFASDWLELQYGWLPLLSDIHNAVEYASNRPKSVFIRAAETEEDSQSFSLTVRSNIDGGSGKHQFVQKSTWRKSYIAEVHPDAPFLKRLAETGMLNPLTVAWELVPFSFVVDWFLPVGSFLSSLTATLGIEIRGCLYVERRDIHRQIQSTLVGNSSADRASGFGEYSTSDHFTQRDFPGFPSAKLPHFKNPISTTHAANALALVVSIFSKGK